MLISKLMGSGLPAALAQAFCADIADNQTATGTTQTDALATGTSTVRCTTVASGTGVRLNNGNKGDSQIIINDGLNTLSAYPPVGHTIDGLSANAAFSIPAASWARFERVTVTRWVAANDAASTAFLPSGTGGIATDLQTRGRMWVLITDYMTAAQIADAQLASPTLDHATAMTNAVKKIMGSQGSIATRGGEIYIPGGLCINLLTDPFGVLPNNGTVGGVPDQASIRIYGAAGAGGASTGTAINTGASQINFQYTTSNNAKIDTRGRGVLEIDHLTLKDTSGNSEPFIFTSNTVIKIHENEFFGSKTSGWNQDCIILGSTGTTIGETATAPFQGYGSQIYRNKFHKIRRAVYGRVYANGVPVFLNTVWLDCGFATGAPFEFDGDPTGSTQSISGLPLHHNLVEMTNYKYGVVCRQVTNSTLGPNDLYDPGASTTAYYTFGTGAVYNLVIGGQHTDTKTFVEETGTAIGKNSWLTSHQSQETVFSQLVKVLDNAVNITTSSGSTVPPFKGTSPDGSIVDAVYSQTTDDITIRHTPAGGSLTSLFAARDFGSGTIIWTIPGTDCRIRANSGNIKLDGNSQVNGTLDMTGAVTMTSVAATSFVKSSSATGGIGYATGAGGTVGQGSGSGKATAVTLSKATGEITMDNAALNANTTVSFALTNTAIAAGDHILVQHVSGGTVGSYLTTAVATGASAATVYVRNITAGNLSEAIVLKVSVLKAVTS